MRLERWQFVVEMAGMAAVVASLVALIVELGQTQAALAASTYQARAFDSIESNEFVAESEHLAPLLARFDPSDPDVLDALTPEERLRLTTFFSAVRTDADNEHYQHELGFLGDEYAEYVLEPRIRRSAPVWRALGIDEPRPTFRRYVDELLAE